MRTFRGAITARWNCKLIFEPKMREVDMGENAGEMGVSVTERGVHVRAAHGGSFFNFLLYRAGKERDVFRFPFPEEKRVGHVWVLDLSAEELARAGFSKDELCRAEYAFEGEFGIFSDPYGTSFRGRDTWGNVEEYGTPLRAALMEKSFDWEGDKPLKIPLFESIIYRLHVRGFTMGRNSNVTHRGTFSGIAEKIPYLKDLGITAIELLPMQEFEEVIPHQNGKLNYWGYTKANHFAPKASYCKKKLREPTGEFRNLVKEMHRAGIEVIVEFYFDGSEDYAYILSALRHYVVFYHVDGIHLSGNINPSSIAGDPYLAQTKLFFERFGLRGERVQHLAEHNEDFLRDMRRFLKGDEGMTEALCFHTVKHRECTNQVHFFANTNGFTMMDMVSYDGKHNEANGENNRDGSDFNYSWNCGAEGRSEKKQIKALRARQIRNAFLLLFLSQGTPFILSGDEFGNSQKGNNNAYCQDNAISWLNWNDLEKEKALHRFVKECIAFRKRHPVFCRPDAPLFMDPEGCGMPDVSYHGMRAWQPEFEPWRRQLGVLYSGAYAKDAAGNADASFYVMYNMHWEAHEFALPNPEKGAAWHLAVSTEKSGEAFFEPVGREPLLSNQQLFCVQKRSIAVLISKPFSKEKKRRLLRAERRKDGKEETAKRKIKETEKNGEKHG